MLARAPSGRMGRASEDCATGRRRRPSRGGPNRQSMPMLWKPPAPIRDRRWNSAPTSGGSPRRRCSSSRQIPRPPQLPSSGMTKSSTMVPAGIGAYRLACGSRRSRRWPRAGPRGAPRTASGRSRTSSRGRRRCGRVRGRSAPAGPTTAPTSGSRNQRTSRGRCRVDCVLASDSRTISPRDLGHRRVQDDALPRLRAIVEQADAPVGEPPDDLRGPVGAAVGADDDLELLGG